MIKYIILDVDGTLTDGGVYYDENNNEIKKFCTKDGTGIICAQAVGITVMVVTGRECKATARRLSELGVTSLFQGVKQKDVWIKKWMIEKCINRDEVGYIGDDINDISSMRLCGFVGCPADAAAEVKSISDYVSTINGGYGAARDVIEFYLKKQGLWENVLNSVYNAGI